MIHLGFQPEHQGPLKVLCLGAHSDDIEIGCGGTILDLSQSYPGTKFYWVVMSAPEVREHEALHAAQAFAGEALADITLKAFPDGFMPYVGAEIKRVFEELKDKLSPDIILCPWRHDAHQDHRLMSELTWNTFRNHLILEYEIPKYDGDMGRPNVFVPLDDELCRKKTQLLLEVFQSQHAKPWFEETTFLSLMRLRGMECNSPSGYAEAFHSRKILL